MAMTYYRIGDPIEHHRLPDSMKPTVELHPWEGGKVPAVAYPVDLFTKAPGSSVYGYGACDRRFTSEHTMVAYVLRARHSCILIDAQRRYVGHVDYEARSGARSRAIIMEEPPRRREPSKAADAAVP